MKLRAWQIGEPQHISVSSQDCVAEIRHETESVFAFVFGHRESTKIGKLF